MALFFAEELPILSYEFVEGVAGLASNIYTAVQLNNPITYHQIENLINDPVSNIIRKEMQDINLNKHANDISSYLINNQYNIKDTHDILHEYIFGYNINYQIILILIIFLILIILIKYFK